MPLVHGFELVWERQLNEYSNLARFYRHEKTGAELLSLINSDENKVFGITFRTPPGDSTGVAHILEHSVLCGSRKYPVKEPFVELLKSSLQTFLNAFTFPDKTCYPVASQNVQDFYNLMDVYLDAVFHPRLTRRIFEQEGWHFHLTDPGEPLKYKGVVYNEMKGAYSSPDGLCVEYSQQALFPDNAYGLDSGGDPFVIPRLTYEDFLEFHRRFYHPGNSRIYFYGDDDPETRLAKTDEYLSRFDPLPVDSEVKPQPPLEEPRRVIRPYAAGEGDSSGCFVTVNWLLPGPLDPDAALGFMVLEHLLVGMPSSPVKKALIESGLGEDLAGVGLEYELRQMYFSTGLKGTAFENADAVQDLVLKTLSGLACSEIPADLVEASVNSVEFELRENNYGRFPRGLVMMLRSLATWLYDGDPLALPAFETPLAKLKERLAGGEPVFEDMIARHFLKNPHRALLVMVPDKQLASRLEAREKAALDKAEKQMSPGEKQQIAENTRQLIKAQQTPDPPEALASIPVLKLSDLDPEIKKIPIEEFEIEKAPALFHDLDTNGVAYLDVGLNLHCLDPGDLALAPIFGRALLEMGTKTRDFVELTRLISRKTGGIDVQTSADPVLGSDACAAWMFLRGKATAEHIPDLVGILREVLTEARLDDKTRFRQLVLEEKAQAEEDLIPRGHAMIERRLRSRFNEAGLAGEILGGVGSIFFLRDLARKVDHDWPSVLAMLETLREKLATRGNLLVNATMDRGMWDVALPEMENLVKTLPEGAPELVSWPRKSSPGPEGLTIPAQVNYVGKGADLVSLGWRFSGSALVAARYLRNSYLWDRVRVQGGAYGAFCLLDHVSGVAVMASYRDPNLADTLDVFDRAGDYLTGGEVGEKDAAKAVIGAIGDMDVHLLPDAKGFLSMRRRLTGITDEYLQDMREQIFKTRLDDFRDFGRVLGKAMAQAEIAVLASEKALVESSMDFSVTRVL